MPKLDFSKSAESIAASVPIETLNWRVAHDHRVNIYVRRDDLIDEKISGNKFYKLHGHLQKYISDGCRLPIASFGGAYSNHLHALAAVGLENGIQTVGVIRGEKPKRLSPTLEDCQSMGMRLVFVSRQDYRRRDDPAWLESLEACAKQRFFWIPEGGGGELGRKGAMAIGKTSCAFLSGIGEPYNAKKIYAACGTATTFCAIVKGSQPNIDVVGVPVLKIGKSYVNSVQSVLANAQSNWTLMHNEGHFGGYAKFTATLAKFMAQFEDETGLLLDPVYTAKLFLTLKNQIQCGQLKPDSHVIAVHSGGLQGRRGFALT